MPTGIEEAVATAAAEIAKESSVEIARGAHSELTSEIAEAPEVKKVNLVNEAGLKEHKVRLKDVDGIFDSLKERGIKSITKASEELGDRLSRAELERRHNSILEVQPRYGINPETNYPFRADYKFAREPGSSLREVVKTGNHFSVTEKISSVRKEALLDVKNHSVDSINRFLPDTLEKIERMKRMSPDTETVISVPEDVALNRGSANAIIRMQDAGARVITHAPYEATMRQAIRRYFEMKSNSQPKS